MCFSELYFAEPSCTELYNTVLYCTLQNYTILYSIVLYCTVLYCTIVYCNVLYCTILYCTVLYYTVLYCTVLYYTVLYCCIENVPGYRGCWNKLQTGGILLWSGLNNIFQIVRFFKRILLNTIVQAHSSVEKAGLIGLVKLRYQGFNHRLIIIQIKHWISSFQDLEVFRSQNTWGGSPKDLRRCSLSVL